MSNKDESEKFLAFMNDRGEMRRMPYFIRRPVFMRDYDVEQRLSDESRERTMWMTVLVGACLMAFSLL